MSTDDPRDAALEAAAREISNLPCAFPAEERVLAIMRRHGLRGPQPQGDRAALVERLRRGVRPLNAQHNAVVLLIDDYNRIMMERYEAARLLSAPAEATERPAQGEAHPDPEAEAAFAAVRAKHSRPAQWQVPCTHCSGYVGFDGTVRHSPECAFARPPQGSAPQEGL